MANSDHEEPETVATGDSGLTLRCVTLAEFEARFEEILMDAEIGIETIVLRDGAPFMRCIPIKRMER